MLTNESLLKLLRLTVVLLFVYIIWQTVSVLLPITIAIIITFLLNPFVDMLQKAKIGNYKNPLPRALIVALVMIVAFVLLFLILTLAIAPLLQELTNFVGALPAAAIKVRDIVLNWLDRLQTIELPAKINESIEKISADATSWSIALLWKLVYSLIYFMSNAVEIVIAPLLAYYFLIDGRRMVEKLCMVFPVESRKRACEVFSEIGQVIKDYINGQFIICFIIGVAVTVGTYFLGLEYYIVLGLIAALLETIPYIGPIAGAVPGIFFAFVISPELAIKTAVFYILIHQVEANIVVPNVMGKKVAIHPVIIMLSMLVGGKLFGIIGMMVALPVVAILRVILQAIWFKEKV